MNLPIDFQNQMKKLLGEAYDAFASEYDKPYFSALRVNTGKIGIDELCKLIEGSIQNSPGFDFVPWENRGIYYDSDNSRPGKSPLHEAGLYYIQEPSAMLPVSMLDVTDEGMRVLDLCAAPGGKTTQIAACMKGKGILIANEIVPQRAKILSENIERMGVSNALVISADPRDICGKFAGFFDRILVDAPCSGEGMFRKNPDAMDEWSLKNVELCAERQAWVMDCAATMLRAGGRMVYSTCTFNDREDEQSVMNFLDRHPEFEPGPEGMHRIYPHLQKGEGHFSAVLTKMGARRTEGESPEAASDVRAAKKKKGLSEKPAGADRFKPYFSFIEENLSQKGLGRLKELSENGIFLMFGDNLYIAPADTPVLKGLKVLRPGLHLGTVIKDRFEPSHALALYLRAEDVIRVCDFSTDAARKYLKGESVAETEVYSGADFSGDNTKVPLSGKKANGWTLVLVEGYSLGWGKVNNFMLKNHYPKGLRWM